MRANHADEKVSLPAGETTVGELTAEVLRAMVKGGIERAAAHGVEWKSTLLSFVVLMFLAAPNFDEYEKTAEFFAREKEITDENLEPFLDEMTDEDWEAVEARYDARAWTLPAAEVVTQV